MLQINTWMTQDCKNKNNNNNRTSLNRLAWNMSMFGEYLSGSPAITIPHFPSPARRCTSASIKCHAVWKRSVHNCTASRSATQTHFLIKQTRLSELGERFDLEIKRCSSLFRGAGSEWNGNADGERNVLHLNKTLYQAQVCVCFIWSNLLPSSLTLCI